MQSSIKVRCMLGAHRSVEQENFQPFSTDTHPASPALAGLRIFSDTPKSLAGFDPPGNGKWQMMETLLDPSGVCPVQAWTQIEPLSAGVLWEWIAEHHVPSPSIELPKMNEGELKWNWLYITRRASVSQYDQLLSLVYPPEYKNLPNLACIALEGSSFHGTHGRSWKTSLGNLHLSTSIHPEHYPLLSFQGSEWVMAAACATRESLISAGVSSSELKIKWMNDVLASSRKIAGALTGSKWTGKRLDRLVWGIGVNVLKTPELPERTPLTTDPVSLRETLSFQGINISQHLERQLFWGLLFQILAQLAFHFRNIWSLGMKGIFTQYNDALAYLNQPVQVLDEGSGMVMDEGIFKGVETDLSLQLQTTQYSKAVKYKKGRIRSVNHIHKIPRL